MAVSEDQVMIDHRQDRSPSLRTPGEKVLAVLCDFGDRKPQEIVTYIVRRLQELLASDEKQFREYMTMLEVLSENRDLKVQVAEAERMLTEIDVKRLPSYIIGYEDGEARGEARGEAKGETKREALIARSLLTRFEPSEVAELLGIDAEHVARFAAGSNPGNR